MKLSKFLLIIKGGYDFKLTDPEVEFVGIKWQEEHHPSAELFPIDFVDATYNGNRKLTLKFITTKHNQ